jgi:hypothetical protein
VTSAGYRSCRTARRRASLVVVAVRSEPRLLVLGRRRLKRRRSLRPGSACVSVPRRGVAARRPQVSRVLSRPPPQFRHRVICGSMEFALAAPPSPGEVGRALAVVLTVLHGGAVARRAVTASGVAYGSDGARVRSLHAHCDNAVRGRSFARLPTSPPRHALDHERRWQLRHRCARRLEVLGSVAFRVSTFVEGQRRLTSR